ncbi:hypothetical protein [Microbispora rosea]|uniref:hypothetical protein n=1 Tax=Microbispora rosea TaxID=58117 RepID=UPI003D8F4389
MTIEPAAEKLERFRNPDFWHRPANYWFWHRIPTEDEILEQLTTMRQAGYGSFQVAVRLSWPLEEYLSREYLAAVRTAADTARRLGLRMGVYDDYNWLSGHAGGKTVAGHDSFRESHLFWTASTVADGRAELTVSGIHATDVDWLLEQGAEWVFDGGSPRWADWELQGVFLRSHDGEYRDVTDGAVITRSGPDGATVAVEVPGAPAGARVAAALSARCATSRMIDYLDPAAARRFTEVGLQPYVDALGDHIGDTVVYVFFDQPHSCFWDWTERTGTLGSSLMYSTTLREAADRKLDGGWRGILPSLLFDDAAQAEARARFFSLYAATATDAFFGTVADWCHEHGLLFSGHEVLAHVGSWDITDKVIADDVRSNFGMDYFRIDAFRDVTAVDARNNDAQLSAKFGDSVARAHGRSGCIVEQYYARVEPGTHFGAGQWELRLSDMRAQAIRHHLLGARQFLEHAFWLTDGDERDGREALFVNPRFDFPPGMNFEPWFGHHRAFADESAALSQFLDEFEPDTDVALVYPLSTIAGYGPAHPAGAHFAVWAETMARHGVPYRIVDERAVVGSRSDNARITIGDARYRCIVLPGVQLTPADGLAEALEGARAAGVRVVTSGPTLSGGDGARERDGAGKGEGVGAEAGPPAPEDVLEILKGMRGGDAIVITPVDGRTLWTRTGRDQDATLYAAAFNDADTPAHLVVELPEGRWRLSHWTPSTGEVDTRDAGRLTVLNVDAQGIVCVSAVRVPEDEIPLTAGWTLTLAGREAVPVSVETPLEEQLPEPLDGAVTYVQQVRLPQGEWELVLDGMRDAVEVFADGEPVGRAAWPPYRFAFDRFAGREVRLEIAVAPSAADRYYRGSPLRGRSSMRSGITEPPRLVRRPIGK